jgi:hypothetical protein
MQEKMRIKTFPSTWWIRQINQNSLFTEQKLKNCTLKRREHTYLETKCILQEIKNIHSPLGPFIAIRKLGKGWCRPFQSTSSSSYLLINKSQHLIAPIKAHCCVEETTPYHLLACFITLVKLWISFFLLCNTLRRREFLETIHKLASIGFLQADAEFQTTSNLQLMK